MFQSWIKNRKNPTPQPSPDPQVKVILDKLRKYLGETSTESEEDVQESAFQLIQPDKFMNIYFDENSATIRNQPRKWRVRVLLSPVELRWISRKLGKMYVKRSKKFPYGLLHSALLIGHNLVDWGEESISFPHLLNDFTNFNGILAFDVDGMERDIDEAAVLKGVEVICRWNKEVYHSHQKWNCQTFVNEVLNAMGLRITFTGVLKEFMDRLLESCSPADIVPSFTTHSANGVTKEINFTTHKDLDLFCWSEKYPESSNEFRLLKAFDRIMWAKYYASRQYYEAVDSSDPNSEKLKAEIDKNMLETRPDENGCPFGDPSNTLSFLLP